MMKIIYLIKKYKMIGFDRLILLGIICMIMFLRYQQIDFPLERDEGGFAYMARLILEGHPPYSEAYDFKPPGLYYLYALFIFVFGSSNHGIHLGLLIVNIISTVLLFSIIKKTVNSIAALYGSATFGFLSLSSSVLGFAAHATHFVVFFVMIGLFFQLHAFSTHKKIIYFLSGFMFGTAILMKQPAIFFIIFALVLFALHQYTRKCYTSREFFNRGITLITGILLPVFLTLLFIYWSGVWDQFWFWTISYALRFGEEVPLHMVPKIFSSTLQEVTRDFTFLWLFAFVGLILAILNKSNKYQLYFKILFLIFSLCAVGLGFHFRSHYYILLLPVVSLFVGVFFTRFKWLIDIKMKSSLLSLLPLFLFLAGVVVEMINQPEYFFPRDVYSISRKIYNVNPFPESQQIGDYLRDRTNDNDRITVLGSEPQILFYSQRNSATRYLFMYFLMEKHEYSLQMQKEMAAEIEKNTPKFIVYVKIPFSWLVEPSSEKYIFNWAEKYLTKHYKLVGIIDIFSNISTIYKWDDEARDYTTRSGSFLQIFERKNMNEVKAL